MHFVSRMKAETSCSALKAYKRNTKKIGQHTENQHGNTCYCRRHVRCGRGGPAVALVSDSAVERANLQRRISNHPILTGLVPHNWCKMLSSLPWKICNVDVHGSACMTPTSRRCAALLRERKHRLWTLCRSCGMQRHGWPCLEWVMVCSRPWQRSPFTKSMVGLRPSRSLPESTSCQGGAVTCNLRQKNAAAKHLSIRISMPSVCLQFMASRACSQSFPSCRKIVAVAVQTVTSSVRKCRILVAFNSSDSSYLQQSLYGIND
eukprot:355039-Chlamydomonas_euryale.AAC.14